MKLKHYGRLTGYNSLVWGVIADGSAAENWAGNLKDEVFKICENVFRGKSKKAQLDWEMGSGIVAHFSDSGQSEIWQSDSGFVFLNFFPDDECEEFDDESDEYLSLVGEKIFDIPLLGKPRKLGEIEITSQCLAILDPEDQTQINESQLKNLVKKQSMSRVESHRVLPILNGTYEVYFEKMGTDEDDGYEDDLGDFVHRIQVVKKQ